LPLSDAQVGVDVVGELLPTYSAPSSLRIVSCWPAISTWTDRFTGELYP
jgi:hypothetical protein